MEEPVNIEFTPEDQELNEEDVPSIVFYLIESYNSIETMDTGLMDKQRARQINKWKDKIWSSIDYYIQILPSND